MNDLEIMLLAIGDLEFSRRKLTMRVQELEAEKYASAEKDKKPSDPIKGNASQRPESS